MNVRTASYSHPAALPLPLASVLCQVPVFTRPLIGPTINFADCLIGSPISSQSTVLPANRPAAIPDALSASQSPQCAASQALGGQPRHRSFRA